MQRRFFVSLFSCQVVRHYYQVRLLSGETIMAGPEKIWQQSNVLMFTLSSWKGESQQRSFWWEEKVKHYKMSRRGEKEKKKSKKKPKKKVKHYKMSRREQLGRFPHRRRIVLVKKVCFFIYVHMFYNPKLRVKYVKKNLSLQYFIDINIF